MDPTRPASPFSIRGIASAVGGAYSGAVNATSNAIEAAAKPFSRPAGYTPAAAPAPAPAPAPVTSPAPTLGGAIGAIQQHQQTLQNLANGGAVRRYPMQDGGAIPGRSPNPGADNIPVNATADEYMLPVDTVRSVGKQNLDALVARTHTPLKKGPARAARGKGVKKAARTRRMADGGAVDVTRDPNGNLSFSGGNVSGTPSYTGDAAPSGGGTLSVLGGQSAPAAAPAPGASSTGNSALDAMTRASAIYKSMGADATPAATPAPTLAPTPAPVAAPAAKPAAPAANDATSRMLRAASIYHSMPGGPSGLAFADGGLIRGPGAAARRPRKMADGGSVDDEQRKVRAVLAPLGQSAAAQIPGYDRPVPAPDGSQNGLGGTAGEIVNTVNAVAPALGPMGAAGARVVSTLASAGKAAAALPGLASAAPFLPVVAGYGALSSAAAPPAAPAPAAVRTPVTPNAQDQRLASGDAGAPPVPATATAGAAAAPGTPVQGAPGAFRFVDPTGKVLYTDAAGGASAAAAPSGSISPQNAQAMDSLAAKYDAQARGQAALSMGPGAAANLPAGYGMTIGRDPAAEHNAQFDREVLSDRILRAGGRQAGPTAAALLMDPAKIAAEQAASAARESGATERARIQDTGQTLRERETNASNGPLRAAQTTEAQVKAQGAIALQKAQGDYQAALASGDKARISKAEDQLRAAQGKWEKTQPDAYTAVAVPGGVDPATGLSTGSSVVVVNKSTGETKGMSPETVRAGGVAPAQKFETGKVYRDAQGNKAKWDGKQFVPA